MIYIIKSAILADQSLNDFRHRFGPFILIPQSFQLKNDFRSCPEKIKFHYEDSRIRLNL